MEVKTSFLLCYDYSLAVFSNSSVISVKKVLLEHNYVFSYDDLSLSYFLLNFPIGAIFISRGDFHIVGETFMAFSCLLIRE